MKECPACKTENAEDAKFCTSCGVPLAQTRAPENGPTDVNENTATATTESQSSSEGTVRKMFRFSSSSEKFLASIGNGYIENFLVGGKISQTIAALTDKRLYYRGHTLAGNGLKVSKTTEEGSVMVRDITYTGFTHSDPKWMKILGIILTVFGVYFMFIILAETHGSIPGDVFLLDLLFLFPGLLLLWGYGQKKTSIFIIRFPGGGLAFNVNLYPVDESRHFQDALNRAVDAEKGF